MEKILFDIVSRTAEDTENAGATLARLMKENAGTFPRFVALDGGLGAGKTAFTRGFCSVTCPGASVKSPSFALVNEYRGAPDVYHFDVWRINDDDDLYSTGFYDYPSRPGVLICEWAENIDYALPEELITVFISGNGDEERHIVCKLKNF